MQAKKLQMRTCEAHEDQPYTLGCKSCLSVICISCVSGLAMCSNGEPHKLMSLNELVASLVKDDIRAKIMEREDNLEKLFKCASKASSEYDDQTAEMIQLLHNTRDEQLKAIRQKYDKLEQELIERRQKGKLQMADFMEDNVLLKWTELRNQRHKIETRVKHRHEVDAVKGYKEIEDEIEKLLREELPKLQVEPVELHAKDELRDIELEITSYHLITIDNEHGLTTLPPAPTSLTLLKTVELPVSPKSVCHYKGSTYVGLWNKTVARIDSDYKLHESFITCSSSVNSVLLYKDVVYMLLYGSPCLVRVCDMSGREVAQWTHSCNSNWTCNVLTIVSDQVVIVEPPNHRITIYSLTGHLIRQVPCSWLGSTNVAACAVDDSSIVVSDRKSSKVFRFNITTGDVMWTCTDVNEPLGVTCYGRRYVLVASYKSETVKILDINTGKLIGEIADDAIGGEFVFGLSTHGTTLIVANNSNRKVLFYKLNSL